MTGFGARIGRTAAFGLILAVALAGCGRIGDSFSFGDSLGGGAPPPAEGEQDEPTARIQDLFFNDDDPNVTVEVNKYLWNASLEVLGFLPIQTADPFTGVIVTGYGTPPGGRTAYRATILVQDPALEARSLTVALATRSGPAATETVRAVEDAILTRARQLRIRDLAL